MSGAGIVSVINEKTDRGSNAAARFMASFRCQNNERRLKVLLRSTEGEFGDLDITVVANSSPKAAKVINVDDQ